MSDQLERIPRDFFQREPDEQADLLHHTWCNECQEVDLGMTNPVEYEYLGRVFIDGECAKCGAVSTTEVVEGDDEDDVQ